jgi:glycosyltransferase involved in cell wall biosynthesis
MIDFLFGDLIRHRMDGIVGVTDEITSYEIKRSRDQSKPHITIGNGIDVKNIHARSPPSFSGDELQLLCLASVSHWHGLDRLIRGLALYKGGTKTRLFIAGDDSKELNRLKIIVKELLLEDRVIFTGFMSGIALDHLFDITHIAIGTLGMHRNNMKEGSTLKAREYCARGIPFLYGCSDPDFSNDFPYILWVPADESTINIDEIIRFASNVYSDPQHYIKMRAYAEKELDWSVKMLRLKEFCETLFVG